MKKVLKSVFDELGITVKITTSSKIHWFHPKSSAAAGCHIREIS
jgi:hypothetical protein